MKSLAQILANTRVDLATGCRIWLGCTSPGGYGWVWWHGQNHPVHRVVWELAHGCSPGLMEVLHTCDRPPCCEPMHLFLGTQRDNMEDCVAKGRGQRLCGEQNGNHKLTEGQVRKIRVLLAEGRLPRRQIAERYGVTHQALSDIARGKTWKHVQ